MADMQLKAIITAEDQASPTMQKFGNTIKVIAGAAVMGALVKVTKDSVNAFFEAERVTGQLNAVLKSTGGVAGMTADSVKNLSNEIMKNSTLDDDAVTSAQNMLLTFTKIGKDVFPETTKAVTDMAYAMNGGTTPSMESLKSTAIQVGKALQDPVQGVTALQKVGVRLTEQQKEQVKAMVELGDTMGAQKLILNELSTEFGGSAAAAADTYSGKLEKLKVMFGNLQESIGQVVVTGIVNFADSIKNFVASEQFTNWINVLKPILDLLKTAFMSLWTVFKEQLYPELKKLWDILGPVLIPILKILGDTLGLAIVGAILALAKGLEFLISVLSTVLNIVNKVLEVFKKLFTYIKDSSFGKFVGSVGGKVADLFRASGGPVSGGSPYIVGEKGPELFVPNSSGSIVPNNKLSGGVNINIYGNISTQNGTKDIESLADRIGYMLQTSEAGI